MFDVEVFTTEDGTTPFRAWIDQLPADVAARVRIALFRMEQGNFGDHRGVGGGVIEHRLHFGPGHRLYFGRDGRRLVVLLAGGSKKTQNRDINVAKRLWKQYKELNRKERQWR